MSQTDRASHTEHDATTPDAFFILPGDKRLEATRLSLTITAEEEQGALTKEIVVRIPMPDSVMRAWVEMFTRAGSPTKSNLYDMILKCVGNPKPSSPEMWYLVDWARLLRLANIIEPTILRSQPVSLDADVVYTAYGAKCMQGTLPDSTERWHIEASLASKRSKIWSEPMLAVREYFYNQRNHGALAEDEAMSLQTTWGMLRTVAAIEGVLDQDEEELFMQATYQPSRLVIPFGEEEAWKWRCHELDSFDQFDEELSSIARAAVEKAIQRVRANLQKSTTGERTKQEAMIRRLQQYLDDSPSLSEADREDIEESLEAARKQSFNYVWQKAYEQDLKEEGGMTVPLAQALEYEMLQTYHTTIGLMCLELYFLLRHQMTRAERRLFLALYTPSPYTDYRVPVFDQTVLDFIRSSSKQVAGLALCVMAGLKRLGANDLVAQFREYWKTWLWLCDLARSGSVAKIAEILHQVSAERHQFRGQPAVEVSMNDDNIAQVARRLAAHYGTSGIFQQERLLADELNVEDLALQRVTGTHRQFLARLINQYTTPRQRDVLMLTFMSNARKVPTQRQIATRLGISQPGVSQHLKAGLDAIRRGIREEQENGLVDWIDLLGL
jgi:DNA-binding CsgD family transcriptional regulator